MLTFHSSSWRQNNLYFQLRTYFLHILTLQSCFWPADKRLSESSTQWWIPAAAITVLAVAAVAAIIGTIKCKGMITRISKIFYLKYLYLYLKYMSNNYILYLRTSWLFKIKSNPCRGCRDATNQRFVCGNSYISLIINIGYSSLHHIHRSLYYYSDWCKQWSSIWGYLLNGRNRQQTCMRIHGGKMCLH